MTQPDLPSLEGTTSLQRARQAYEATRDLTPQERREYLRLHHDQLTARRRQRLQQTPSRLTATRQVRRRLAAVAALPFLCGVGSAISGSLPEDDNGVLLLTRLLLILTMLFAFFFGWPLLRKATTDLADAPETLLDERELQEKGHVAIQAYALLVAAVAACVVLAVTDEFIDSWSLAGNGWSLILTGMAISAILLPSAVTAWRWTDIDS